MSTEQGTIYDRKLAHSIDGVVKETGLGRTGVFKAISEGRLRARKSGRRTVVLDADLQSFLQALPVIAPRGPSQGAC